MRKPVKKRARKKRIAIFVDAANIFYSVRTLGWKVDYTKFLDYWNRHGKITGVFFYTAVISTRQKQLKFYNVLRKIGFKVITREVKIIRDRKRRKIVQKGNFDVKLAIDLVLKAKEYDIAVLASGDSDFEPAVEYLRSIGKKVIVVSARGHIARELIRRANQYVPLEKLKNEIMKI